MKNQRYRYHNSTLRFITINIARNHCNSEKISQNIERVIWSCSDITITFRLLSPYFYVTQYFVCVLENFTTQKYRKQFLVIILLYQAQSLELQIDSRYQPKQRCQWHDIALWFIILHIAWNHFHSKKIAQHTKR